MAAGIRRYRRGGKPRDAVGLSRARPREVGGNAASDLRQPRVLPRHSSRWPGTFRSLVPCGSSHPGAGVPVPCPSLARPSAQGTRRGLAVTHGQGGRPAVSAFPQVRGNRRSPATVPPAGLEPAAYRLGGRASVAVFGLVSTPVRDDDSCSSRSRPLDLWQGVPLMELGHWELAGQRLLATYDEAPRRRRPGQHLSPCDLAATRHRAPPLLDTRASSLTAAGERIVTAGERVAEPMVARSRDQLNASRTSAARSVCSYSTLWPAWRRWTSPARCSRARW